MTDYNEVQTLVKKIADLDRRLRAQETSARLTAANVGNGGITVSGTGGITVSGGGNLNIMAGGSVIVEAGSMWLRGGGSITVRDGAIYLVDDTGTHLLYGIGKVFAGQETGFIIQRIDGSGVASWYTQPDGSFDNWAWRSKDGVAILADDGASGVNLARPYLPMYMGRARYTDWPKCISSSFETVWSGSIYRQNPRVIAQVGATTDASGTTGQARLMIDGTQVGPTLNIGFGIGFNLMGGLFPIGGNTTAHQLTLEVVRTAGVGNVCTEVTGVWGVQS